MACDTFLKISIKCKRKFVIMQVGEHEPFVDELLRSIGDTIRDLEPHQIHTFYEAVGHMISSEVRRVIINTYGDQSDSRCFCVQNAWGSL